MEDVIQQLEDRMYGLIAYQYDRLSRLNCILDQAMQVNLYGLWSTGEYLIQGLTGFLSMVF